MAIDFNYVSLTSYLCCLLNLTKSFYLNMLTLDFLHFINLLLPAKTHRRAVVKQHEEPGDSQDC
jgi:hypothetical protein